MAKDKVLSIQANNIQFRDPEDIQVRDPGDIPVRDPEDILVRDPEDILVRDPEDIPVRDLVVGQIRAVDYKGKFRNHLGILN